MSKVVFSAGATVHERMRAVTEAISSSPTHETDAIIYAADLSPEELAISRLAAQVFLLPDEASRGKAKLFAVAAKDKYWLDVKASLTALRDFATQLAVSAPPEGAMVSDLSVELHAHYARAHQMLNDYEDAYNYLRCLDNL